MSEKVYRFLLRFYPSRFRRQYGEEAMQVFRDRLRDERGALRRIRLWLDVLFDLTVSAPREYRRRAARPAETTSGVPSFLVLEEEPLRPDMFLLGTVLALGALGTFGYLLTHGGNRVIFRGLSNESLRSAMTPAVGANVGEERAAPSQGTSTEPVPLVTPAERALVIRRVIGAFGKYDPNAVEAQSVAERLEWSQRHGEYDAILRGPVLADVLTREVRSAARQMRGTILCGAQPGAESAIWVQPARRGERAWERIDAHFSVALEPASRSGSGNE